MIAYLAGRYSRFRELQAYRDDLRALGIEVRARWVDGDHEMVDGIATAEQSQAFAQDDFGDLSYADLFIAFTEFPGAEGRARGGRHVEFGIALERYRWQKELRAEQCIRIVVVGPRENVFHYLPEVEAAFESWPECVRYLRGEP